MHDAAVEAVRHGALWFEHGTEFLGPLIDSIGGASVALIGEASHGTHEFYRIRADLTAALIEHRGFNIVAAEADWPDAYRANRWVRGTSADADAVSALGSFTRFPRWMWRNHVVVDFLRWLRGFNLNRSVAERVGFYGLDLYSLHSSMDACSDISIGSIRRRPGEPGIDMDASSITARMPRATATRRRSDCQLHARAR